MTTLDALKIQAKKKLQAKNIVPMLKQIDALPDIDGRFYLDQSVGIELRTPLPKSYTQVASALKPWRKGPFTLGNLFIDAEWKSYIKFNLLRSHLDILGNKVVADIGCGNGYYMFQMQQFSPKKTIGFDPFAWPYVQFSFLNKIFKQNIDFKILAIEHLEHFAQQFDVLFCLGVLYHRSDPIGALKQIKNSLKKGGTAFLDNLVAPIDGSYCFFPPDTYAKMRNVYFLPTVECFKNWCKKAGFSSFEIIAQKPTKRDEQRKTVWIEGQSLKDFLTPDQSQTIEGHFAPVRTYVKAFK